MNVSFAAGLRRTKSSGTDSVSHQATSTAPSFTVIRGQPAYPLVDPVIEARPSVAELAEVVLKRAERRFAARVDAVSLERLSFAAAAAVLDAPGAKVFAFLPELALRQVRESIERDAA